MAEAWTTCQEFDCLMTDDVSIVRRAPYHFLPSYHSLENLKSSVTSGVKSAHLSHSRLLYSHCTMLTCTALSKVFNLRQSFLSGVHSKDLLFDTSLPLVERESSWFFCEHVNMSFGRRTGGPPSRRRRSSMMIEIISTRSRWVYVGM